MGGGTIELRLTIGWDGLTSGRRISIISNRKEVIL